MTEQVDDFIRAAEKGFELGESWTAPGFDFEAITGLDVPPGSLSELKDYSGSPRNSIYWISGHADIKGGENFAFFAKTIKVESHVRLKHVILVAKEKLEIDAESIDHAVLATRGEMKIGSDVRLGGPPGSACDPISALVISEGDFTIQSNNTFRNAQLFTSFREKFNLNTDNTFEGTAIQSRSDIYTGSNNEFMGCALSGDGGTTTGPGSGLALRLVN